MRHALVLNRMYWQPLLGGGEHLRTIATPDTNMLVLDRQIAVLRDPLGRCDAVITREPLLVQMALQVFECQWGSGRPVSRGNDALIMEHDVLGLLLDGATDVTTARWLHDDDPGQSAGSSPGARCRRLSACGRRRPPWSANVVCLHAAYIRLRAMIIHLW